MPSGSVSPGRSRRRECGAPSMVLLLPSAYDGEENITLASEPFDSDIQSAFGISPPKLEKKRKLEKNDFLRIGLYFQVSFCAKNLSTQ